MAILTDWDKALMNKATRVKKYRSFAEFICLYQSELYQAENIFSAN